MTTTEEEDEEEEGDGLDNNHFSSPAFMEKDVRWRPFLKYIH